MTLKQNREIVEAFRDGVELVTLEAEHKIAIHEGKRNQIPHFVGYKFPLMPNQGLITRPFARSSATMDLTVLIGMANPMFCAPIKIAELIPITRSSESTSGPPLLPGLIGVVV